MNFQFSKRYTYGDKQIKEEENSVSDERREENLTPVFQMEIPPKQEVKQFKQKVHNFTYQENKSEVKRFWQQIEYYAVRCQLAGFNDFQMLIDIGLVKEIEKFSNTYRYVTWLWRYASKVLPSIRRRSLTIYRIIRRILDDSIDITEPFEH